MNTEDRNIAECMLASPETVRRGCLCRIPCVGGSVHGAGRPSIFWKDETGVCC